MHQQTITCLNGAFLSEHEAQLPIADRGFRFGDGVFETLRLHEGVPYQWELHLSRLGAGLAALRITPPTVDWHSIARQLIAKNQARGGFLRLSISRGVGSQGYLPHADIVANWAMEYLPPVAAPHAPFRVYVSSITRPALTALPVNHKLAQGVGSTLALMEARDHGADEALMLSHDGHISEASSGNIFWVSGNQLFTPALSTGCLAGTTRAALMRLAQVHEVTADMHALLAADAVFITNARLGLWPVALLLPSGTHYEATHPQIQQLAAQLEADREAYATTHAKDWA